MMMTKRGVVVTIELPFIRTGRCGSKVVVVVVVVEVVVVEVVVVVVVVVVVAPHVRGRVWSLTDRDPVVLVVPFSTIAVVVV